MREDEHCPCCGQRTRTQHGFSLFSLSARGGSFVESQSRPDFEAPERLGNGNVRFPAGWSETDRRTWRVMMDDPGAEWTEAAQ